MLDYIELGAVPCDEPCVQVGVQHYDTLARKECRRYIELLEKKFPNMPENNKFAIKSFSHEFGHYFEVVCWFDPIDEQSYRFASYVEENLPSTWDDTQIK